jgi:hypothetical protein
MQNLDQGDSFSQNGRVKPVYFNSNDYHGHRFISREAVEAGYSDVAIKKDISAIVERGIASMLQNDADTTMRAAEGALLRSLVMHYPNSRNAVKDVLKASSSVGPDVNIEWTSPVREWLFRCLVEEDISVMNDAQEECDPKILRSFLAKREDVPAGAFRERIDESDGDPIPLDPLSNMRAQKLGQAASQAGSLDAFFMPEDGPFEEASKLKNHSDAESVYKEKAALAAQEHLMTVLSASATKRTRMIQEELKAIATALQARSSKNLPSELNNETKVTSSSVALISTSEDDTTTNIPGSSNAALAGNLPVAPADSQADGTSPRFQNLSNEVLTSYCKDLLREFQESNELRHRLDTSAKRITERLMRFSSSTSTEIVEGRLSLTLQKKIAARVDAHMTDLERNKMKLVVDCLEDERLGSEDEPEVVEDELARIEAEWGDWAADDYVWSPDQAGLKNSRNVVQYHVGDDDEDDEDDEETIEEFSERIDREWRNWNTDD